MATELAIDSYFEVERFQKSILSHLDKDTTLDARVIMERSLAPCCRDEKMLDFFTSIGLFMNAVFPPSLLLKTVDPDALMEDYQYVVSTLSRLPEPILPRERIEGRALPEVIANCLSTDSTAGKPYRSVIESTFRICMILVGRLGSPQVMKIPEGHSVPLILLEQHVRAVVAGSDNDRDGEYVNPILLAHVKEASYITNRAVARAVRPVLIWCALVGQLTSELSSRWRVDLPLDGSVYRDLMVKLVGAAEDVDALAESEFEFSWLLNLQVIMGKTWDPRQALKKLLRKERLLPNKQLM